MDLTRATGRCYWSDGWFASMAPIVASVPGFADPADLTFGAGALQVLIGRFGLAGGVRRGPED